MRPDSKLRERHTQKTHPENRPDEDAGQPSSGWEDTVFEDPARQNGKKPDPNWQQGEYNKDKGQRNSADKVFDDEQ